MPGKRPKAAPTENHRKAQLTIPPQDTDGNGNEAAALNEQAQSEHTVRKTGFPIVGIGASAGGLEALERFFKAMPPDGGLAFVIVQHLDPTHKSILTELIRKFTRMTVSEVEDNMLVEPNSVYVIPPNRDMVIFRRRLHLMEQQTSHGRRLPIDLFFRSLATDQEHRAICVVLSGTGTEGTMGLKAIKERDGMVIVQSPDSAQYDGMPRSAAATGLADFILPPEKMKEPLLAYASRVHPGGRVKSEGTVPVSHDHVQQALALLYARTGHDFSMYKPNTVIRRIERRMLVNRIETLADYLRFLGENPVEVETLFKEMLIEVTNFFRDPDAFAVLKRTVIPAIFNNRPVGQPIRVWVAGCSTGEEAYSIAMLLREFMDAHHREHKVQIFATDIDQDAIERARTGVYPETIVADLPSEDYLRFFVTGSDFQVTKSIRDMVVFAVQSVIKDPPFSRLDLVSCRNLLIYLRPELQKQVLRIFHYSLKPQGYMFLGSSESVNDLAEHFEPVDRKWKLFRKKGELSRVQIDMPHAPLPMPAERGAEPTRERGRLNLREIVERALLRKFGPSAAIVNERGDVLYFHGRTGKYLEPTEGAATLNLLSMAREGLRLSLSSVMRQAVQEKQEARREGVQVRTNGDFQSIDISVTPLAESSSENGLLLVVFEDRGELLRQGEQPLGGSLPEDAARRITELERELHATREYLQANVEEAETANEELKATNEELQSVNEELQSTNEELETSREELQSTNEELVTVNTELELNVEELTRTNNDLSNLLASTDIGTIFLSPALTVNRFTPAAAQFVNLIPSDVGRPLAHLVSNLDYPNLLDDARRVLDTLVTHEREAHTTGGRWCLVRMLPYRTGENQIEGIVIAFVDITEQKRAQEQLRLLTRALEQSPSMVMITDLDSAIEYVNPSFCATTGYSTMDVIGQTPRILYSGKQPPEFYEHISRTLQARQEWKGEIQYRRRNGDLIWILASASPLFTPDGDLSAFVWAGEDVTLLKNLEGTRRLAAVVQDSNDAILAVDFDGKILAWNKAASHMYGWSEAEALGMNIRDFMKGDDWQETEAALRRLQQGGGAESHVAVRRTKEGKRLEVWTTMSRITEDGEKLFGVSLTERDISQSAFKPWRQP